MALWGSIDQANNAPKCQVTEGSRVDANGWTTYANTTTSAFVTGEKFGVFGASPEERANTNGEGNKLTHTGWVLRTEGTGGRAGRVHYETLVATGSISSVDVSDDTVLPE